MKQMTVSIATLGCKVNHQESEKLASDFRALGYKVAAPGDPADICIINSCTVTSVSDAKTRQRISQARSKNPDSLVCVIGCLPEVARETVSKMEEVDLVIGSIQKDQTAALAAAALHNKTSPVRPVIAAPVACSQSRTRAFLKAEDGCDQYCAYCIIPRARGPVRSKPPGEITKEADALLAAGYREIVMTGINLARYGADFSRQNTLSLYDVLLRLTGLDAGYEYRIRLGSLEPTVIGATQACKIAALPGICPHFHLSLQSGSDRTLERMGRHYNTGEYREILFALRKIDPHFAITTDVIVGFPGETNEDFTESLHYVEHAGFAKVHVFPYSARSGTRAAGMPGQIPEPVKKARAAAMLETANKASAAFLSDCAGDVRRTLSFGPDKQGRIRGLTDNGIDVRIPAGFAFAGSAGAPPENAFFDLPLTPEIARALG
ncbi:MAG: tRNA (N(6)-L-threonylcarbamoyladenosine(37)-C(2))-methylthiotransferase MtaB [Clostridiales Family XIII bacterium]|jgi:threonylcarbamoyladenosine tRNA methylthiotransferase MtaB|nr:tRNA (N(6)-L-threonylcarbamoyladenosine(37)-C(2))-methylthiotransferase MtaB [Clostridiales Family XIII bacterium]